MSNTPQKNQFQVKITRRLIFVPNNNDSGNNSTCLDFWSIFLAIFLGMVAGGAFCGLSYGIALSLSRKEIKELNVENKKLRDEIQQLQKLQ